MNTQNISDFFKSKTVLVTGAVGSVGSEVIKHLLQQDIHELRAVDQAESQLFFASQNYMHDKRFVAHQANIMSQHEMEHILQGVDYVFHTAALKHVPSCEISPNSAVETNILGMQNLIRCAKRCNIKKMLFTSSDKAVCPTNVMGSTKLIGERLLIAANQQSCSEAKTSYAITRFGNIAGSVGSVIPLFCKQIKQGNKITLTSDKMTRFMMSMQDAVSLVLESMVISQGSEIFVSKMPTLSIIDMTRVLIDLVAPVYGRDPKTVEIQVLGPRHGEKFFEELNSVTESLSMLENDKFLCVLPKSTPLDTPYYKSLGFVSSTKVYDSQSEIKLSPEEIKSFLLKEGVLPQDVFNFYNN